MAAKIQSIQALRAIAATMVVVFHAFMWVNETVVQGASPSFLYSIPLVRTIGGYGVDIFFVISGFVMATVTWNSFAFPGASSLFITKRLIRIFPIYWIYLAIFVGIYASFSSFINYATTYTSTQIIYSLFLLPWPGDWGWLSNRYIFYPTWTLTFEIYFYVIMSCCLLLKRKYVIPFVLVIFFSCFLLFRQFAEQSAILRIIANPLLFEFLFGLCVGFFYKSGMYIGSIISMLLVAAGLGLLAYASTTPISLDGFDRCLRCGIPAMFIIAGLVFLEANKTIVIPLWLSKIGDSSYSLYLLHPLGISITSKLLTLCGLKMLLPSDILLIILVISCMIGGYISYLLLEKPLLKFLHKCLSVKSRNSSQWRRHIDRFPDLSS